MNEEERKRETRDKEVNREKNEGNRKGETLR